MINEAFFKTNFEKYSAKVIKELKKLGVEVSERLGDIMNLISDYYEDVDPRHAAQCIKFELGRGIGREIAHGIRESINEAEEFDDESDDFVDDVLDQLDKYSEKEVYDYYYDHRGEIAAYLKDGLSADEVAEKLDTLWNSDDSEYDDYDPELEDYIDEVDEQEDEYVADMDKKMNGPGGNAYITLRKLHHSGEVDKHPSNADGRWCPEDTDNFIISKLISENDAETLAEYMDNSIPAKLISGDDEDNETIPFDEQYIHEFEEDYVLLTKNVAFGGQNINKALKTMLNYRVDFIVNPFDLYNLFVSKDGSDAVIDWLVENACDRNPSDVFVGDITMKDLRIYMADK